MSNNNPLFILLVGATILSLVLVTTNSIYAVFAQEEKDKDEEKEDEKEKDKDEEKEEEEEKDEESKDREEDEEESKDEDVENSNNDTAATQIIQDQLTPPTNNNDTTTATIVNTTTTTPTFQEPEPIIAMTPTPPPPTEEEEEGEFNATCQCKTTSPSKPKPPSIDNPTNEQIIPITSANIQDSKSFGQVTDPAYTSFYTVPNILDNIIDDVSFWSQAGPSSFYIQFDNTLDSYQVCSAELNVHNPKSTIPYLLDVGVSKNYSGIIDQTNEKIQFDKCVKNMDEIYMTFENPAGSYISISEIKLFGSKLVGLDGVPPPTLQPSSSSSSLIAETEEETEETEKATKINIENSMAEIDIKNSTVTFKFDPLTATFVSSSSSGSK